MRTTNYKRPSVIIENKDSFELGDCFSTIRNEMKLTFLKYMQSKEWYLLGEKIKVKQNYKCHDCTVDLTNSNGVIHHNHYLYFGQGNYEEESSCVFLCKTCHTKRHNTNKMEVPFWAKRGSTPVFMSDTFYNNRYTSLYLNL